MIHGAVRIVVRQDGDIIVDETYPNETEQIYRIELPAMTILDSRMQMTVHFDPPVAHVTPAEQDDHAAT